MSRWLALVALVALAGCQREIAGGRADGAAIYSEVCARCHGLGGVPDAATVAKLGVKPLTSDNVRRRLSDRDIRHQIVEGSENKKMPSFGDSLSAAQLDAIVAHVRTLGATPK